MEDDEEDLLHRADSFSGTFADAGTYSLIGAVAVLGGMASGNPPTLPFYPIFIWEPF